MSATEHRPDVTFVIAAYNAEATLARAIGSALAQRSVAVEVVVVDDCSTDATCEVAQTFRDPRVRIIRQRKNGGPGRARNAGIAAATGTWIAVLDSDDSIRPDRSRNMVARAEVADAQVVVDNLEVVPMNGDRPYRMFTEEELRSRAELTLPDYIDSNVIFRSTFNFGYMKPMYSREFLLRHDLGFDETLRIGEDYILMASALASGARCVVEPSAGYVYHLREQSISRVLELHHVESMLAADRTLLQRFPLKGRPAAAQGRRTRSLDEARSFLMLVQQIKKRSAGGILKTAIGNPRALRHLRMPIAVRMRRFMKGPAFFQSDRRNLSERTKS